MLLFYISLIDNNDDIVTFEKIFEEYKVKMHRVAMKVLKDHHLAEDAVQVALLGIAKNMKTVPTHSESELRAYVFVAARNAAYTILRKKQPLDDVLNIDELECVADDDVFQKIANNHDYHHLLGLIMSLPIIYREVLMLRFVMELTPKEIGQIIGNKTATVSQQITRGKKLLAEAYEREVSFCD